MVKSPATVCNEIYTELRKMKKHFEGADVLHPRQSGNGQGPQGQQRKLDH